ncbi:MAG: SAM-dependent methyltransferase, partial [Acidobacteriota bacterium]
MSIDEQKLNELLGRFVGDLGATLHAGSIVIGEKLGLYKAMASPGERVTAPELAKRTGTNERYVREWLNAQAASGYVEYDAAADSYFMTDEQAFVMTNEDHPAYLPGAFILATSALRAVPELTERFKTGDGFGWHEHHHDLFRG